MGRGLRASLACALLVVAFARGSDPWALDVASLTLVDCVDCAVTNGAPYSEYPAGISVTQTIGGTLCRTLPNASGEMKYFAYRVGVGMGLQAGREYVLCVDYPEDQARSFFIRNHGCETTRGLQTGTTVGDCLHPPYVNSNPESLRIPLAGGMHTWQQLFRLQDRFPDIKMPNGSNYPRPWLPADGFWVVVCQFAARNAPLSAGAAVSRIRLYEAPPVASYALPIRWPRRELPQRHLFWREEMADGVIGSSVQTNRGVNLDATWYEGKAHLMRFLGVDTFGKDLLEFGSVQGWDSRPYGGNDWYYYDSSQVYRWQQILDIATSNGLRVLPYYEYKGSRGTHGLGGERRARPLGGATVYTQISWAEVANADLTDPDTLTDACKLLDCTVLRLRTRAPFLGAWFRTRPSDLPMGFEPSTLARFSAEANGGVSVTRTNLQQSATLLNAYYAWWLGRRQQFLGALRDYLRTNGVPDAMVLLTTDSSEPGASFKIAPTGVVTDDSPTWQALGESTVDLASVAAGHRYLTAQTSPMTTWAWYEWQHSIPWPDPQAYVAMPGCGLTYSLHKAYTATDPAAFDAFRSLDGLTAIRHYCLNENTMNSSYDSSYAPTGDDVLGYFVSDVDRTGPFCMLPEALAMANGDPRHLGYLSSSSFNRGFPDIVRRFNANFLALPALPSRVATNACADPDVVVRLIDTGRYGIYLAIVNTGWQAKSNVTVALPATGAVTAAATGEALAVTNAAVTLALDPCELRALYLVPAGYNLPPVVDAGPDQQVSWPNVLAAGGCVTAQVCGVVSDDGLPAGVLTGRWSVVSGAGVTIVNPGAFTTAVLLATQTVAVLQFVASDGACAATDSVQITVAPLRARLAVNPASMVNESGDGDPSTLFDEQALAGDPPTGDCMSGWSTWHAPAYAYVDFGAPYHLTEIDLYDINNIGVFTVASGVPGQWTPLITYTTSTYKAWVQFPVDIVTRYLRFSKADNAGIIGEAVLYESGGPYAGSAATSTAAPPTIVLGAVDGVDANGATVRGTLSSGGLPASVTAAWGPLDAGTNLALWPFIQTIDAQTSGTVAVTIPSAPDTRGVARLTARTEAGLGWSDVSPVFGLARAARPPFRETFEADAAGMAGVPGPVHIQNGWTSAPESAAIVTNGTTGQACAVNGGDLAHAFTNVPRQVWLRLRLQPRLSSMVPDNLPVDARVVFWMETNQCVAAYDGQTVVRATLPAGADADGWYSFRAWLDHDRGVWSLWQDQRLVLSQLHCRTNAPGRMQSLIIRDGNEPGTTWADDIAVEGQPGGTVMLR